MYLYADKYFGDWKHSGDDRRVYAKVAWAAGLEGVRCEGSPSLTVQVTVAYWRKANAIHKWFVDNVQDGKDDCQTSYVEREKLEELAAACRAVLDASETVEGDVHVGTTYSGGEVVKEVEPGRVLANPGVAKRILPTTSGFFFGGTDYDQYYLDDLRETVKQLRAVLDDKRFEDWGFHYHASW